MTIEWNRVNEMQSDKWNEIECYMSLGIKWSEDEDSKWSNKSNCKCIQRFADGEF